MSDKYHFCNAKMQPSLQCKDIIYDLNNKVFMNHVTICCTFNLCKYKYFISKEKHGLIRSYQILRRYA